MKLALKVLIPIVLVIILAVGGVFAFLQLNHKSLTEVALEAAGVDTGVIEEAKETAEKYGIDAATIDEFVADNAGKIGDAIDIYSQLQSGEITQEEASERILNELDLSSVSDADLEKLMKEYEKKAK